VQAFAQALAGRQDEEELLLANGRHANGTGREDEPGGE
jgi:hypothetical protein